MIQAFKFVDRIDFERTTIPKNESYLNYSNFEPNDKDIEQSNTNTDNESAFINKTITNFNSVEQLCKAYIKSKHTKIVKSKKMTPMTRRLQEVYADL